MNWILIVLLAGNIHFTEVTDTEADCVRLGTSFAQDGASYVCASAETISKMMEGE